MRLIADENIPLSLVKILRRKGHTVLCLQEKNLLGIDDMGLISLAKKEKMVLLTFDKDFLDSKKFPSEKHSGILVVRMKDKTPEKVIPQVSLLLDSPLKERLENNVCELFDSYLKVHHSKNDSSKE